MAGDDMEVCGFINVKLTRNKYATQNVKKRSLTPWKTWKRQWCSIKKLGPGLGVEVQFNCCVGSDSASLHNEKRNFLTISSDVVICRIPSRSKQFTFGIFPNKERKPLLYLCGNSETETQQWMANIRQLLKPRRQKTAEGCYNVSLIDNAHSRAAGLSGLYGDLIANQAGIFIKDAHTGEVTENFAWKEFDQFHLTTAGRPEDVKRICVICTTKEFRAGIGELFIFCLDASNLLQDLITRGRGSKHKLLNHRSISLSEGDLRIPAEANNYIQNLPMLRDKNASSLINIGQEMLPSTSRSIDTTSKENNPPEMVSDSSQSCRVRAIDNVYETEPSTESSLNISSDRRVSSISIASGIYEEILDDEDVPKPVRIVSNLYEDPKEVILAGCGIQMQPPPLPPRQRFGSVSTENSSNSDDGSELMKDIELMSSTRDIAARIEDKDTAMHPVAIDTSDYIPMSPRIKDIALYNHRKQESVQEDVYVVMR